MKAIYNWLLHVGLFLILFWGQKETTWFENRTKEFILMGSLFVVSALINIIPSFYKRPLLLGITQKNRGTKKDYTSYVKNESSQRQRTIEMTILVKRRIGWNWLLNLYLKRHSVFIKVECNPTELYLQAIDETHRAYEIIPFTNGSGFYINLTTFLKQINKHRNEAEPSKKFQYFLRETKEVQEYYLNSDAVYYINPELIVDQRTKAPFILKWALGWQPEQHKIEFFNNGG